MSVLYFLMKLSELLPTLQKLKFYLSVFVLFFLNQYTFTENLKWQNIRTLIFWEMGQKYTGFSFEFKLISNSFGSCVLVILNRFWAYKTSVI